MMSEDNWFIIGASFFAGYGMSLNSIDCVDVVKMAIDDAEKRVSEQYGMKLKLGWIEDKAQ